MTTPVPPQGQQGGFPPPPPIPPQGYSQGGQVGQTPVPPRGQQGGFPPPPPIPPQGYFQGGQVGQAPMPPQGQQGGFPPPPPIPPQGYSQGGQVGQTPMPPQGQQGGFPPPGYPAQPYGYAPYGYNPYGYAPYGYAPQGGYPPPPPPPEVVTEPIGSFGRDKSGFTTRIKVPSHSLKFDENNFLRLLAGSISLSKDEKKRIIEAVPRLTQYQVDELMRILEEEISKFSGLDVRHKAKLDELQGKHRQDWEDLEAEMSSGESLRQEEDELAKARAGLMGNNAPQNPIS